MAFEQIGNTPTKPIVREKKKRWWEMYKEKKKDIQIFNENEKAPEEEPEKKEKRVLKGGISGYVKK